MAAFTLDELREFYRYEPDTGNFYLLKSRKYGFDLRKPVTGSPDTCGYIQLSLNGKDISAHRAAWALHYGEIPSSQIDHIDRNKRNNRISNLRPATIREQSWNVGAKGSIPAKGVSLHKGNGAYYARIRVSGKRLMLGYFDTIDEAAHAYNKAAILHHGEFAVLNPIGQDKA